MHEHVRSMGIAVVAVGASFVLSRSSSCKASAVVACSVRNDAATGDLHDSHSELTWIFRSAIASLVAVDMSSGDT